MNTNITLGDLERLPIRAIDFNEKGDISIYRALIQCVIKIVEKNKAKKLDKEQISHFNSQIDKFVYQLYGLTESQIDIVEEAVND